MMFWSKNSRSGGEGLASPQQQHPPQRSRSGSASDSIFTPSRKNSACPILPPPITVQPLRLSNSWTTTSTPEGSSHESNPSTSSLAVSCTGHSPEHCLTSDGFDGSDPIAPFSKLAPKREPPLLELRPSKSSRILGITPTEANYPSIVVLGAGARGVALTDEHSSVPRSPELSDPAHAYPPAFPCQRSNLPGHKVLEARVKKTQQQVTTVATPPPRSFSWRKAANSKRDIILTTSLNSSSADRPRHLPTSSPSFSATFSPTSDGTPSAACLHAFKPSQPDEETERLVLTPQSFVAVGDSGSERENDRNPHWGVRFSGVCVDTIASAPTTKMQEWSLEVSSQQEMVIWHSTIRSIITALVQIDNQFRLGPQRESSYLLSPPVSAAFGSPSYLSSPPPSASHTPSTGNTTSLTTPRSAASLQASSLSDYTLPPSAEPLVETVRKLNLATAQTRGAQEDLESVDQRLLPAIALDSKNRSKQTLPAGTKVNSSKVVPSTHTPATTTLKILIPPNEEFLAPATVTTFPHSPALSVDTPSSYSTASSRRDSAAKVTAHSEPLPSGPSSSSSASSLSSNHPKDSPTFGWTIDVSDGATSNGFRERHMSPVSHWRGKWGVAGGDSFQETSVSGAVPPPPPLASLPTSATSSIDLSMMGPDADTEEKIRDSLDLDEGRPNAQDLFGRRAISQQPVQTDSTHSTLSSKTSTPTPTASPSHKKRRESASKGSASVPGATSAGPRRGSVSSVSSSTSTGSNLPPLKPPPAVPLPDVPQALRQQGRRASEGVQHFVPARPVREAPKVPGGPDDEEVQQSRRPSMPTLQVPTDVVPQASTPSEGASMYNCSPDSTHLNFLILSPGIDSAGSTGSFAFAQQEGVGERGPAPGVTEKHSIGNSPSRPVSPTSHAHTLQVKKSLWEVIQMASQQHHRGTGVPTRRDGEDGIVSPTSAFPYS